jgi:hypothetical protein
MKGKIKNLFVEPKATGEHKVSPRAARLAGLPTEDQVETQLRAWVKDTLSTAPWLAVAMILFGVFVSGAAVSALAYGLMKAAFAIVGTVAADKTMFNGMKDPKEHSWVPMLRRTGIFVGICWLMAVV